MDTSSNLDYLPCALWGSDFEEVKLLYKKIREAVFVLVSKLKPVMKYLATPVYFCEKVSIGDVKCKQDVSSSNIPHKTRGIYLCEESGARKP